MEIVGNASTNCVTANADGTLVPCGCVCRCDQVDPDADPAPAVPCCIKATFADIVACVGTFHGTDVLVDEGLRYVATVYYDVIGEDLLDGLEIYLATGAFPGTGGPCWWTGVIDIGGPLFRAYQYDPDTPEEWPEDWGNPEITQTNQCLYVDAVIVQAEYDAGLDQWSVPGGIGGPSRVVAGAGAYLHIRATAYVTGRAIYTAPQADESFRRDVVFPVVVFAAIVAIDPITLIDLGSPWTFDSDLIDGDDADADAWLESCHGDNDSDRVRLGGLYDGQVTLETADIPSVRCFGKSTPKCQGYRPKYCACANPADLLCLGFSYEIDEVTTPVNLPLNRHGSDLVDGNLVSSYAGNIEATEATLGLHVSLRCADVIGEDLDLPEDLAGELWVWLMDVWLITLADDVYTYQQKRFYGSGGTCPESVAEWFAADSPSEFTGTVASLDAVDTADPTASPCFATPITCADLGDCIEIAIRRGSWNVGHTVFTESDTGFVHRLERTTPGTDHWEASELGWTVEIDCAADHFTMSIDDGGGHDWTFESDDGIAWTETEGDSLDLEIVYFNNCATRSTPYNECALAYYVTLSGTTGGTNDQVAVEIDEHLSGSDHTGFWTNQDALSSDRWQLSYDTTGHRWSLTYSPDGSTSYTWASPLMSDTECPIAVTDWILIENSVDSSIPAVSLSA